MRKNANVQSIDAEETERLTLWAAGIMPAGQWIITIGAAMVAVGLTANYWIALRKAEKGKRVGVGAEPGPGHQVVP